MKRLPRVGRVNQAGPGSARVEGGMVEDVHVSMVGRSGRVRGGWGSAARTAVLLPRVQPHAGPTVRHELDHLVRVRVRLRVRVRFKVGVGVGVRVGVGVGVGVGVRVRVRVR